MSSSGRVRPECVEPARRAGATVLLDDRTQLVGGGTVEDHTVAPEVELATDLLHALSGGSSGSRRQPLRRDQIGDVFQLFRGG